MPRILVEIKQEESEKFRAFLYRHRKVDSFQKIGKHFLINLVCRSKEEYLTLIKEWEKQFSFRNLRKLCRGKCINNTDCLNTAKYGDYCWRHQPANP